MPAKSAAPSRSHPEGDSIIAPQGLCTLIAIGLAHSANPRLCGVALALFAAGVAVSVLLIAAYSRPFTGDISVDPDLLKEVQATLGAGE